MPDFLKVAKFGGTSMADANAMRRCASIVHSDSDKKIVVVSATSGTTNLLTGICSETDPVNREPYLAAIREKHLAICEALESPGSVLPGVKSLLDELEDLSLSAKTITLQLRDKILSYGELLSSTIFTQVLRETGNGSVESIWLDARDIIITDHAHTRAEPEISLIEKKAEDLLVPRFSEGRFVTQGFIGSTENGVTTTLGRGGSDYSAALFAEAINADVLEIWTDVTAIYTTDPRIVPDARPITEISFDEAAELSVFGAKVLHPATMVPAIRKNIRVYVGSSIHPDKPGTWILRETRSKPVIRAISLRRNQTLVTVHSLDMLHRHGFLAKLFEVLARNKISVDLVTTSEVSVSLTLDTDLNSPGRDAFTEEVLNELRTFCQVEVERNLSLIAMVGNNLHATSGLSGPVFSTLQDVNIRLICHGASSHNLCFLVEEGRAEDVVRMLHKRFIK
jgi:aspartate kinase